MNNFKRIWNNRWILRSLPKSIYFNFHYLPFMQAIHLPILLYKAKFNSLGGSIRIEGGGKFGMIKLGVYGCGIYPNSGVTFSNNGDIVFNGKVCIGNESYISVGSNAKVVFGNNFMATAAFRLTAQKDVVFGDFVRFGWDSLIMDSDHHKMRRLDGTFTRGYGYVKIGSFNWFGNGCRITKNVVTPDYLTIAAGTYLTTKVEVPSYSVICNKKSIDVIANDMWLDPNNEKIDF